MLTDEQLQNLDVALEDTKNKKLILDIGVDIQALLRILVDKEIISREEVEHYRDEVRNSPKWKGANHYIQETMKEIAILKSNPQAYLRLMFERKLRGK